ncbi:MAG: hypothetical protein GY710_21805 [Desulfobacteraceae bacterium]|nr:hypothetical protein [Desulfobacteraceae bacterium]
MPGFKHFFKTRFAAFVLPIAGEPTDPLLPKAQMWVPIVFVSWSSLAPYASLN